MTPPDPVSGEFEPRFQPVRDELARQLAESRSAGASFAVFERGRPVIDLWGGLAAAADGAWRRDSLGVIYSGSKGLVAFCILLLHDRGLVDFESPVAEYWPQFAAAGKDRILVRHVLSHTAGVPAMRAHVEIDELADDRHMAALVARERPIWPPGDVLCYHPLTYGWILGELVRRIDGRSIGRFFDDEFAQRLGLDAWIGLPDAEQERVVTLHHGGSWAPYAGAPAGDLVEDIVNNPRGRHDAPIPWNRGSMLGAEVPAINGVASARAMAGLYALLTDPAQARLLFRGEPAATALAQLASGVEYLGSEQWRFGAGFRLGTMTPLATPGLTSVGHPGAGGSVHGAWPELGYSFSFVMNELRGDDDQRAQRLLDALYVASRP